MDITDKQVLVFGTGISGIAATKLLEKQGAHVILYDANEKVSPEDVRAKLGADTQACIEIGAWKEEFLKKAELAVLSPGVPTDLPAVLAMKESGIPIWGEVELAYRAGKGDVLAITGTNGKTTTTALLGKIMEAYQEEVYVVGNIGNPYTSEAEKLTENSVVVAEVSSFQLETIETFRPKVSAILNLTPDHLNRHHTMEQYIAAKERIVNNQIEDDFCVLNYEDERLRRFAKEIKAHAFFFSSERKLDVGIYLEDGNIIYKNPNPEVLCHVTELKLLGIHNYENVMAAAAMAALYGVPLSVIRSVVCSFTGVEHRIEFVTEEKGVAYYNDSKGTNPDAAIRGILAMNRPTYLIGGGYDKQSEYKEWIASFGDKVKLLVLIGETKEKIAREAQECGFYDYVFADSLEEAVAICKKRALEGEAVLLSPACASWDMFKSYEERGDKFKELVKSM